MSEALNLKLLLFVIFHLPVISLEALLVLHKISMMSKTSVKTLKLEIVPVPSFWLFTFLFCINSDIQTGFYSSCSRMRNYMIKNSCRKRQMALELFKISCENCRNSNWKSRIKFLHLIEFSLYFIASWKFAWNNTMAAFLNFCP